MIPANYVLGFLFRDNDRQVALICKARPVWQAGRFNGIGGKIEKDEPPHAAIVREFHEETGLRFEKWQQFAVLDLNDAMVHCFMGRADTGDEIRSLTDEPVGWYPIDVPMASALHSLKWLIPLALDPTRLGAVKLMGAFDIRPPAPPSHV